jgi:DNA repair exonuclease SbcCD ATPase subunit/DNA repair exonuclease SbcCD nuclease subunit
MEVKTLNIQHTKVEKIFHTADIHIRNVKRHTEYREVFDKFFDDIIKQGTDNSIIIIAGDIAHSKVETSPELMREMSYFMSRCADITDTIIIPGNHDLNCNNKNRLDVITPVAENLKHPHLHHLNENGLYKCKNILFSHFDIMTDVEDYVTAKKIAKTHRDKVDTLIALWHGPMNSAKTDIGYKVSNNIVTKKLFDGFDIVILGDIHMYQRLQKYNSAKELPEIVYCGSMIQQNHGELISNHGYCVWDVARRSHVHVDIPNDYGFFTADVKDGKLVTDISSLPSKARLRIRCFETEPNEVKKVVDILRSKSDLQEISYIRGDAIKHIQRGNISKVPLVKLNEIDFQNNLIENYLKAKNPKIEQHVIDKIFEINRETNQLLTDDDRVSNIQWIPKKFEFSNMFSYGENNVIDFTKLDGIAGIFASNASGKSSAMDAFCFCLWDKCSRTYKAVNVMNESKMSFKCKAQFEINGIDYFVERKATRNKKGDVRVDVNFWRMVDGERENLNDESRRSTNDVIRSKIGSYDDFILTALSLQKNNSNFADKGQSDRKDLIAKFLGITIFDKLSQISYDELRGISAMLKQYNHIENSDKIKDLSDKIYASEQKYTQMMNVRDELTNQKESFTEDIRSLNSKIVNLIDVPDDIDDIQNEIDKCQRFVDAVDIDRLKQDCLQFQDDNKKISNKLTEYENNDIESLFNDYNAWNRELSSIETEIELLKVDISNKLKKVEFLDEHEYDSECEFCMKNVFVQDAMTAKEELQELKPIAAEKVSVKRSLETKIENNKDIPQRYNEYVNLKQLFDKNEAAYHKCISSIQEKEKEVINTQNKIDNLKAMVKRFYDSKDIVEQNDKLHQEIEEINSEIKNISIKLDIANTKIMETHTNINVWKTELKICEDKVKEVDELELKEQSYKLYNQAVNRDGVPYDIICKSIPAIESEINNILSQIVDFNLSIEMDGKNVNANIVYDEKSWPLELTSGMETFVSNLAIRIALTNISNMPRTTFLMIDEGLGALDSDILASMSSLFTFLKTNFDFILMITHIDAVKDFADQLIEIKKVDGFSKMNHQ